MIFFSVLISTCSILIGRTRSRKPLQFSSSDITAANIKLFLIVRFFNGVFIFFLHFTEEFYKIKYNRWKKDLQPLRRKLVKPMYKIRDNMIHIVLQQLQGVSVHDSIKRLGK